MDSEWIIVLSSKATTSQGNMPYDPGSNRHGLCSVSVFDAGDKHSTLLLEKCSFRLMNQLATSFFQMIRRINISRENEILIFFGCRKKSEDCLFYEEWLDLENNSFCKIHFAFSRESSEKQYVSHLIEKHSPVVGRLLKVFFLS